MTFLTSSTRFTLLAVLSVTVLVATAPAAMALPLGAAPVASNSGSLLQKTAANQHRVYPGADDASAQKARAGRNAPNLFCEKQENRCE